MQTKWQAVTEYGKSVVLLRNYGTGNFPELSRCN